MTTLSVESTDTHCVVEWTLDESEDFGESSHQNHFGEDDGQSWMQRLLPLRDELLHGDFRALYLGWLAASEALRDDAKEPSVPFGLKNLTDAQQALVDFLDINSDMLMAAKAESPPGPSPDKTQQASQWLDTWTDSQKSDALLQITMGRELDTTSQIKMSYAAWLASHRPTEKSPTRQVSELRKLAQAIKTKRVAKETAAQAERDIAIRKQHEMAPVNMMTRRDDFWQQAGIQATRASASGYTQVERILNTLAEGYTLTSDRETFEHDLQQFLAPHARRMTLLNRLYKAGLMPSKSFPTLATLPTNS